MSEIKSKSIFDFLNDLTFNKVSWEDQSESDRKKIQPYMMTRWFSMNQDYLDLISECQVVTDTLTPKQYYQFYLDLLPKKKFFTKYISNKSDKEKKYKKVIEFLSPKLQVSESQMEEYLEILFELPGGFTQIKEEIMKYGYDEKSTSKEFGL